MTNEETAPCPSCGAPQTTADHRERCNAAAPRAPTTDPIADEVDRVFGAREVAT